MTKVIICRHGEEVLVDDDIYEELNAREWKLDTEGYPKATVYGVTLRMHNVIMPVRDGYDVDHKSEDKLDNRRSNLEYLTKAEHTRKSVAHRVKRKRQTMKDWAEEFSPEEIQQMLREVQNAS